MHIGGRENNLMDEILGHAHAEDIQFGFLRNLVPPVMHPPPGTIDKVVVCPSRVGMVYSYRIPSGLAGAGMASSGRSSLSSSTSIPST